MHAAGVQCGDVVALTPFSIAFWIITPFTFWTQVALNQLVLGPVVAAAAFVWTLALQGKGHLIINKIHMDFLTTLVTGKAS